MTTVALALIVFAVVLVVAVAAAIWSGQLPLLRVLTGAKTVGPVGKPAAQPQPYTTVTEADSSFLDGDFQRSLALGFTETPDAFADRMAALEAARRNTSDQRKEQP